jgi:hypothetical protein
MQKRSFLQIEELRGANGDKVASFTISDSLELINPRGIAFSIK